MQPTDTDTSRKRTRLTPKQGQFAALVARGESLTVAYFEAYDTNASGTCLRVQAWRLSRNPKVSERITALREGSHQARLDNDRLTRDWIINGLREEAANPDNPASARVRALEVLGKMMGMFKGNAVVTAEPRSPEEIKAELMEKLTAIMPTTST